MSAAHEADALRRLLGDVQRLGLTTASTVIDRFSAMVRGLESATAQGFDGSSWREAVGAAAQAMVRPSHTTAVETVVLSPAREGGVATGTAWLHNTTAAAATGLTLQGTGLAGPAGAIPAEAVTLTPCAVATLAAGASLPIDIEVKVPPDQSAGLYRGMLVMTGPPDGAVVLRLVVTDRGGTR